jgi:hypothetical protein
MTISFQGTVYIPDNGDINKLPPSPGTFPLYHVKDYGGLPETVMAKGDYFFADQFRVPPALRGKGLPGWH